MSHHFKVAQQPRCRGIRTIYIRLVRMQTIDIRNALRKAQEPSCITATFPSELKNMSEIGSNECEFAKDRRRNYKIPNPLKHLQTSESSLRHSKHLVELFDPSFADVCGIPPPPTWPSPCLVLPLPNNDTRLKFQRTAGTTKQPVLPAKTFTSLKTCKYKYKTLTMAW